MTAVILLLALSAPAPVPKATPPRPAITGVVWAFTWYGDPGHCEFRPGGTWWAWFRGREWAGTWSLDGGTLRVEEWTAGRHEWEAPGKKYLWEAKFKPGKGLEMEGGFFVLRRPPE